MITVAAVLAALAFPAQVTVVMPVDGENVLPAIKNAADQAVRQALAAELGDRLLSRADTDAVLDDAVAAGLNCSLQAVDCTVRVGIIAGASEVLVPTVRNSTRLEISIVRVDVVRAAAVAVTAGPVQPSGQNDEALRALMANLLKPAASIAIDVGDAATGTIVVDGVAFGRAPLVAPVATTPGSHIISLVDNRGMTTVQRAMTVSAGFQRITLERAGASFDDRRDEPARAPTMLIAGGVVGGVGALTAFVGGILLLGAEAELSTRKPGADDPAEVNDLRSLGLFGTGVVVLGAAAIGVGVALVSQGNEP
jgi:hypothetical protein